MKIYISADFEGATGIVDRHQCFPGNAAFEWARKVWIQQINAIVEGAKVGGCQEFLVNEAHAGMNYILPELLHPEAAFISGYVKIDNQMQGLDRSFIGAIIMGHAKAGTQAGVLNHTYVMRDLVDVRLNGETVGELGLNMLWAAYLGVPVILVIGDDEAAQEALEVNPKIETAVVKYGLSQFTAHHLPLERANQLIRDAAERSVHKATQGAIPPVKLPDNFEMEIDFSLSEIAHLCSFIPSIERVSGRTVRFSSSDYREVQHLRIICSNLALATIQTHY